jgi:hypothetical protein
MEGKTRTFEADSINANRGRINFLAGVGILIYSGVRKREISILHKRNIIIGEIKVVVGIVGRTSGFIRGDSINGNGVRINFQG